MTRRALKSFLSLCSTLCAIDSPHIDVMCAAEIRRNNTFYFNLNDDGFYTNFTLECGSHGGAEIEIFEKAELSALEELEKINYSIDLLV